MKHLKENNSMADKYKEYLDKQKQIGLIKQEPEDTPSNIRISIDGADGTPIYTEYLDGSFDIITNRYGVANFRPAMIDINGTDLESGINVTVPDLDYEGRDFFTNMSTFDMDDYDEPDDFITNVEYWIENSF